MTDIARAILRDLEIEQQAESGSLETKLALVDCVVRTLEFEIEKAAECWCRCQFCRRAHEND